MSGEGEVSLIDHSHGHGPLVQSLAGNNQPRFSQTSRPHGVHHVLDGPGQT